VTCCSAPDFFWSRHEVLFYMRSTFVCTLTSFLFASFIPIPVRADVPDSVHKLCIDAKDYAGCVRAHTMGTPERITIDQGLSTNEGNSCPHAYGYRGGGNCTEVICYGKGLWLIGESNDQSLAGKEWSCKGGFPGSGGVLRWGDNTLRASFDPKCPSIPFEIGWNSTCSQSAVPQK